MNGDEKRLGEKMRVSGIGLRYRDMRANSFKMPSAAFSASPRSRSYRWDSRNYIEQASYDSSSFPTKPKKRWNKKGMFFTIAAIALGIILLVSFRSTNTSELQDDVSVVEVRISTMNNFIKDVEQDLEKGLRISSFRAFASMNEFVASNGSFIGDVDAGFSELMLNGSLLGTDPSLMQDSTFIDWADKIEVQAQKLDIDVEFIIADVQISQDDPWTIQVTSQVNFTVNDSKGTSSWQRSKSISTNIPIKDFEDPLYLVNSDGKITNTIDPSPIIDFVDNGDMTNLMLHANNSYYIISQSAPSYLKRLEGDLSNSSAGIESLVNVADFEAQGISALDRSIVDYIYFGIQATTNYRINNTPSWFKIDSGHLGLYEVGNWTI